MKILSFSKSLGGVGRSGIVGGRSLGFVFLGFYQREACQYQTNSENILYNKSR